MARRFGRRIWLVGASASLGLPFFESLPFTGRAEAQTASRPTRYLVFYTPNGHNMSTWRPSGTGSDYQLNAATLPLEPFRDDIQFLSGVDNPPAKGPTRDSPHATGTASFLTCTTVTHSQTNIRNGISADQVYAGHLGAATPIRSLQLGLEGMAPNRGDNGYGNAYLAHISWANEITPLPQITRPGDAFEHIFSGYDPGATSQEIERRNHYRSSVLDLVTARVTTLNNQLSQSDRAKLDEYLTGVRELERAISGDGSGLSCDPSAFDGSYMGAAQHADRFADVMALAFQCDATRVISFMLGNSISYRRYPEIDAPSAHHDYSHHINNQATLQILTRIDRWEMERFAYLLGRLRSITEEDGSTLLDNSIVFYGNENADGNYHELDNLPIILAGRGRGQLSPGVHHRFNRERMSNLHLTMLNKLGVEVNSFGDDSTGVIQAL